MPTPEERDTGPIMNEAQQKLMEAFTAHCTPSPKSCTVSLWKEIEKKEEALKSNLRFHAASRDWPMSKEDEKEHGRYGNTCVHCGHHFTGPKRQHTCRLCSIEVEDALHAELQRLECEKLKYATKVSLAITPDQALYLNQTPICNIINALNRKVMEMARAGQSSDFQEARLLEANWEKAKAFASRVSEFEKLCIESGALK